MPASDPAARRPSSWLALTEVPRALAEFGALLPSAPLLAGAPRGDGHVVLVLPGLAAGDAATALLRGYLRQLGYDARGWTLGRNMGPRTIGRDGEHLRARLDALHAESSRPVSVIGWSLGGIMARMLGRWRPAAVRQVITLGSPFAGSPRATNVWRAYEWLSGERIDDALTEARLAESAAPSPVPATAIWSRGDGVVSWRNCIERDGPEAENIEVHGSHFGMTVNAAVLYAVADRLALPLGGWTPFDRSGWRALLYPAP
jgi:pimeloyl-ACP methyl ester carboxylesterase